MVKVNLIDKTTFYKKMSHGRAYELPVAAMTSLVLLVLLFAPVFSQL